jgi:predicted anti-sigma-YlaC factor YlaD
MAAEPLRVPERGAPKYPSAIVARISIGSAASARHRARGRALGAAGLALLLLPGTGCSLRRLVIDRLGAELARGGAAWNRDDDPQLVADAFPFALKTLETLVAGSPDNERLLLATCRGFVSYSAAFVAPRAEAVPAAEFETARALSQRALRLDLRALGYCRRALELRLPGAGRALERAPEGALAAARRQDVELLYWTGAAWGSAIALGTDRPDLVADLPAVRALFGRAGELDPDWGAGALDEAWISLEALPAALGGSPARARQRLESAVAKSGGRRATPWVTWAASAAVAAQDRAGFRDALEKALAVDPDASPDDRLPNLIAQERARHLLARADELFISGEE